MIGIAFVKPQTGHSHRTLCTVYAAFDPIQLGGHNSRLSLGRSVLLLRSVRRSVHVRFAWLPPRRIYGNFDSDMTAVDLLANRSGLAILGLRGGEVSDGFLLLLLITDINKPKSLGTAGAPAALHDARRHDIDTSVGKDFCGTNQSLTRAALT